LATKAGRVYDGVKGRTPTADQVKSGISDQTARAGDAYRQAKSTVGLRDYGDLAQTLKEWLPDLVKDGGLSRRMAAENRTAVGRLGDLSEDDLDSFVRGLYAYCSSLNIDLEPFTAPATKNIVDDQLKKTVGEIVRLHAIAQWKADEVQDSIEVLVNLQKWLERPFAGRYREFNRQLFTVLLAEELVAAPPIELFLAPEEEREDYTRDAIGDLIASDNQRFYLILKTQVETVAGSEAESDEDGEPSETAS
jgi:hypothetical protein